MIAHIVRIVNGAKVARIVQTANIVMTATIALNVEVATNAHLVKIAQELDFQRILKITKREKMAQYKYPNYEELDITTKAWLMDEIAKENGIDEVQDYISNWIANNVFPEDKEANNDK